MAILTKIDAPSSFLFELYQFIFKKVSISLGKLCLKLTKCVTIKYSVNEYLAILTIMTWSYEG